MKLWKFQLWRFTNLILALKAKGMCFDSWCWGSLVTAPASSDWSQSLCPLGPQFQCDTSATTDIVLLVDGSWSIGRSNFKLVREFLSTLVSPFNIARDKIRIGKRASCLHASRYRISIKPCSSPLLGMSPTPGEDVLSDYSMSLNNLLMAVLYKAEQMHF